MWIDAVVSAVVLPAYLSGNLLLQVAVWIGLNLAGARSMWILVQTGVQASPGGENLLKSYKE